MSTDPRGGPRPGSSSGPHAETHVSAWDDQAGADRFLSWLDCCIARTAAHVPELISSAQEAAARYGRDGQEIGLFGDEGLVSEAYGRSGGLMRVSSPTRVAAPDWQGVVLCFPREGRLADDLARISELAHAGRHIVIFGRSGIRAAAEACGLGPHAFVTCHATAEGGLLPDRDRGWVVPTLPAAAIVALWAWLGEFVAACTRAGRMPVMYQSYDVGGSPAARALSRHEVPCRAARAGGGGACGTHLSRGACGERGPIPCCGTTACLARSRSCARREVERPSPVRLCAQSHAHSRSHRRASRPWVLRAAERRLVPRESRAGGRPRRSRALHRIQPDLRRRRLCRFRRRHARPRRPAHLEPCVIRPGSRLWPPKESAATS